MTPKQKYDERRRLRIENDLRAEQRRKDGLDRQEDAERQLTALINSFERIASVMELWADKQ